MHETGDQDNEILQKSIVEMLQDPSQTIITVCANGRTRSKELARALEHLGYSYARAVPSHRYMLHDEDLFTAISQANIFVFAGPDIETMFKNEYARELSDRSPVFITIPFTEPQHQIASGYHSPQQLAELRETVQNQLIAAGFTNHFSQS